ncbi:MAG TPA: PEGA domain-containing protein [Kofleriaceae bacterium]|jgi:tetratricopeptide (TPR) repeat protein
MRRIVLLAILLASAPAAADPPPAERARALLDEGTRLYADDAAYSAALAAFRESFKLDPSWRALNGIGLCLHSLGREVEAFKTYQQLLDQFGPQLSAEQRQRAEELRADIDKLIARLDLSLAKKGAQLSLDGELVGSGPIDTTVMVMPGAHQLVATLEGHRTYTERIEIAAGDRRRIQVSLEPVRERVVVKREEPVYQRRMPRWIPWVTAGAGVALAGAGGILALDAAGDLSDFDDGVADSAGALPRPVEADGGAVDRAERKQAFAAGLAIAGGAAVVTGLVLAVLNQPRPVKKPAASGFRIVPMSGGIGIALDH